MDKKKLERYFCNVNYDISKNSGILKTLSHEYDKFLALVTELPEFQEHRTIIQDEISLLINIIKSYEDGKIFDSIASISMLMDNLKFNLDTILINEKSANDFINKSFYRMRLSEIFLTNRKEIFHVPRNFRNKVNAQRYSIHGFPCLYLSSSVYNCWLEMSTPLIQNTYISQFELDKSKTVSIMNFSMIDPRRFFFKDRRHEPQSDDLQYFDRLSNKQKYDSIILWPLVFACSLYGSDSDSLYKPEYIIPQLILQWIKCSTTYKGIAYLAVGINTSEIDPSLCINYVFPVQNFENDLCSYLSTLFKLTKPVRCDIIENNFHGSARVSPYLTNKRFLDNNINNNISTNIFYELTIYGRIERYLDLCTLNYVSTD